MNGGYFRDILSMSTVVYGGCGGRVVKLSEARERVRGIGR